MMILMILMLVMEISCSLWWVFPLDQDSVTTTPVHPASAALLIPSSSADASKVKSKFCCSSIAWNDDDGMVLFCIGSWCALACKVSGDDVITGVRSEEEQHCQHLVTIRHMDHTQLTTVTLDQVSILTTHFISCSPSLFAGNCLFVVDQRILPNLSFAV